MLVEGPVLHHLRHDLGGRHLLADDLLRVGIAELGALQAVAAQAGVDPEEGPVLDDRPLRAVLLAGTASDAPLVERGDLRGSPL
jgi:hypothetical protein